jgi:hypothetical protein
MKKLILLISIFIISCSENDEIINTEWVFVACEGNYGASNGSVYMINQFGEMDSIPNLGDVVQSVEVHENKLFVLVNNSHKLHVFDISSDGVSLPGIEINLYGSGPREMIVDGGRLYFSNWNSKDIKYLDLFNYKVEKLTDINGLPEGIVKKGDDLYIAVNMNEDYSSSDKVVRYDINENNIKEIITVGDGPLDLEFSNNELYVSRTYYDENYAAYHGTSQFSLNNNKVLIKEYGKNTPCGGSVHSFNNKVYRSALGGIAELDDLLNLIETNVIGNFNQSEVYSVEVMNDKVYFGLTDYNNLNKVKVISKDNLEIADYNVGKIPGDFALWKK